MTELESLRVKLAARKGQPGFKVNVAMIEARIAQLEGDPMAFRDIATGEFRSTDHALANPDTTRRTEI